MATYLMRQQQCMILLRKTFLDLWAVPILKCVSGYYHPCGSLSLNCNKINDTEVNCFNSLGQDHVMMWYLQLEHWNTTGMQRSYWGCTCGDRPQTTLWYWHHQQIITGSRRVECLSLIGIACSMTESRPTAKGILMCWLPHKEMWLQKEWLIMWSWMQVCKL